MNEPKIETRAGSSQTFTTIDIYNRYDGMTDRGEQASGYNGKNNKDTLTFGKTTRISNSWGADIGISKNDVSAKVGYNVTKQDDTTWSYTAEVSPKKTTHIGLKDCYHVQQFTATITTKTWIGNSTTPSVKTRKGKGFAQQWYKFHFYSWET